MPLNVTRDLSIYLHELCTLSVKQEIPCNLFLQLVPYNLYSIMDKSYLILKNTLLQ